MVINKWHGAQGKNYKKKKERNTDRKIFYGLKQANLYI